MRLFDHCTQLSLQSLHDSSTAILPKLKSEDSVKLDRVARSSIEVQGSFRFDFGEDPMALHKLVECIEKLTANLAELKCTLSSGLQCFRIEIHRLCKTA